MISVQPSTLHTPEKGTTDVMADFKLPCPKGPVRAEYDTIYDIIAGGSSGSKGES